MCSYVPVHCLVIALIDGNRPVSRDLSQHGYETMRSFIMGAKADWAEEGEGSHYRQYQHLRQARSGREHKVNV